MSPVPEFWSRAVEMWGTFKQNRPKKKKDTQKHHLGVAPPRSKQTSTNHVSLAPTNVSLHHLYISTNIQLDLTSSGVGGSVDGLIFHERSNAQETWKVPRPHHGRRPRLCLTLGEGWFRTRPKGLVGPYGEAPTWGGWLVSLETKWEKSIFCQIWWFMSKIKHDHCIISYNHTTISI